MLLQLVLLLALLANAQQEEIEVRVVGNSPPSLILFCFGGWCVCSTPGTALRPPAMRELVRLAQIFLEAQVAELEGDMRSLGYFASTPTPVVDPVACFAAKCFQDEQRNTRTSLVVGQPHASWITEFTH